MYFWSFRIEQWYLPDSKVTNFNISIVGINVNWLTGKFAMDQIIFIQEIKTLQDFEAPIFYDNEPWQPDLLEIFTNGSSCYQLSYKN